MCVIIENKSNKPLFDIISQEEVLSYMDINPDGFGITYFSLQFNYVATVKGFSKDDFLKYLTQIETTKKFNYYIHFRKATVGKISLENTHPFDVMGDKSLFLMHNGTLPLFEKNQTLDAKTSDTYFLSQEIKQMLLINGSEYVYSNEFQNHVEFLLGKGRAVLINSQQSVVLNKQFWFNVEDNLLFSKQRKDIFSIDIN